MAAETEGAHERVRAKLKLQVVSWLNGARSSDQLEQQRPVVSERLRQVIHKLPQDEFRALRISRDGEEDRFLEDLLDEVIGAGPLDRLLRDPTISEIMINGPREIFVEREGRLERLEVAFRDSHHLMAVIERLLGSVGATVNESNPTCDASLLDGSRLNVIIPPLALNGPIVTIRRKLRAWTMADYTTIGALTEQTAEFLQACVRARVNMVISGGTSTGKTALVSILSAFIPADQRIITIENVAELDLPDRQHWIRLVGRPANIEGKGEIPMRLLVKNALRMRPDRIILGEARGGEALDVVQAMHSGHDGFFTVLHANTPQAALERLETLMLMSGLELPSSACRMQIASAVDLIIHLGRFSDGSRRVETIAQVLGSSAGGFTLEDLFVFENQGFSKGGKLQGCLRYTGARPKFLSKFHLNNVEVPAWLAS